MSVCMSVRARNSKTMPSIDLIFVHKKYYPWGSSKMDLDPDAIKLRHDVNNEKMRYDVTCVSGSAIYD